MAKYFSGDSSAKRGMAMRALAPLGLFAAGYLAVRGRKPVRYAGSLFDRAARRLLFQSLPETQATQERTATSLIAELTHKLYLRLISHNLPSVAAGAAFFVVLAIFPGLAAMVSLYGLIGNPADIGTFIDALGEIVPHDVIQLIHTQFIQIMTRPTTNLSTFLLSLVIALWSANSGMKAVIEALNIVYDRIEKRSIIKINILAGWMTLAFIVFMAVAVNIMILPQLSTWLRQIMGAQLVAMRWRILLLAA